MKKRIFTLLLCLVLALSLPGYAQMAAQGYDTQGLDRFSSFALDESTGEWSVSDPTFEALLDAVAAEEGKNAMKDGFAVFQLRLSGNEQTGTLRPEIEINFFANEPIGVRAVSLLAGGKRFDVNAQAQSISAGGVRGERVVLPMRLADDLELIAGAEEITLVLYGETDVYRTEISATEKARNARERLEKASLGCFDLLETLESFHVDSYDLWDRSWSEWNAALDYDLYYSSYAAESIELITLKDRGEDVEKLQQLLIAAGFYVGEEEYEFKEKTAEAVARAQEYYGMVVTGAADEGLISCLQGGDGSPLLVPTSPAYTLQKLGDVFFGVGRWWHAARVAPINAPTSSVGLVCADSDNILFVCEGLLVNDGETELGLGWEMTAELLIDGNVRYSCTLRAESDEGEGFTSTVLPLAQNRVVAAAEIPSEALEAMESAALLVHYGTESLEIPLVG